MNTKKIIIGLGIVLVILIIIIFIIQRRTQPQVTNITPSPTPTQVIPTRVPTPIVTVNPAQLDAINTIPADGAININPNATIEVTFSRVFQADEIKMFMNPPAERIERITGNKLIATPKTQWTLGTTYHYSFSFTNNKEKNRTFSFTVTGPTVTPDPLISGDTSNPEVVSYEIQKEREEHPDIYLTNHSPYEAATFSITSEFKRQAPAHFGFIVILKGDDKEKAKQDFIAWLKSLQLRDDQIASLDIQYQ